MKRILMLGSAGYVALWLITAILGTWDTRSFAYQKLIARPGASEFLTDIYEVNEQDFEKGNVRMPFYFLKLSAPCPLMIKVRYHAGYSALGADGGYAYFLWIFGFNYMIHWQVVGVS